jgi:hypothetical protein
MLVKCWSSMSQVPFWSKYVSSLSSSLLGNAIYFYQHSCQHAPTLRTLPPLQQLALLYYPSLVWGLFNCAPHLTLCLSPHYAARSRWTHPPIHGTLPNPAKNVFGTRPRAHLDVWHGGAFCQSPEAARPEKKSVGSRIRDH